MKKSILAVAFTLVGIVAVSAQTTPQKPATANAQTSTQTQGGAQWSSSDVAKEAQATGTAKATTTIDGATTTATEAMPSATGEVRVEGTKAKGTTKGAKKAQTKNESK
ncbi:hypothetical protein [Chryseobacterium polytrichastri]|uniref:Uncharacterized protein n=1 Tax=Chryseobacterium polytrichastri TaxID=1302687 RepID=A0A1M7BUD8_9FLAO|nr:hypothetical protein [Chryseobacterium polytrichastri]SHL58622.1 hypothetical protein SAMN05444267_102098 [Chryseobacterium polytrichastri]